MGGFCFGVLVLFLEGSFCFLEGYFQVKFCYSDVFVGVLFCFKLPNAVYYCLDFITYFIDILSL